MAKTIIPDGRAVVDRRGKVLDDHGTPLIFQSEAEARRYLRPYIRKFLKQQFGRVWLAPYRETRKSTAETAYASGKGEEITD